MVRKKLRNCPGQGKDPHHTSHHHARARGDACAGLSGIWPLRFRKCSPGPAQAQSSQAALQAAAISRLISQVCAALMLVSWPCSPGRLRDFCHKHHSYPKNYITESNACSTNDILKRRHATKSKYGNAINCMLIPTKNGNREKFCSRIISPAVSKEHEEGHTKREGQLCQYM